MTFIAFASSMVLVYFVGVFSGLLFAGKLIGKGMKRALTDEQSKRVLEGMRS